MLGCLLVVFPAAVLLLAATGPLLLLLASARLRVLFVVFGGILVFQSSQALTPQKLLFLAGVAVAVAGSLGNLTKLRGTQVWYDVEPLLRASKALLVVLAVSLPVALGFGTAPTDWLRDVAPYLLLAIAPLLALDAESAWSTSALRVILMMAGVVGCAAFTAAWLARRGIAAPPVLGLPTLLLGAALFAYAVAFGLEGRRHALGWILLASGVFAGLISTGTRSSLVLLIAPVAIVLGSRERMWGRWFRMLVSIPVIVLVVFFGVRSVVTATDANVSALSQRIQLLSKTGERGDGSYFERQQQGRAAWRMFKEAPLLGQAPGHPITWSDATGTPVTWQTVDSPVGYLAKFGLVGIGLLAILVWGFLGTMRRLKRRSRNATTAYLALIGFSAIVVAWSVLQVPFEDKGLASGFLLLLALASSEASTGSVVRRER